MLILFVIILIIGVVLLKINEDKYYSVMDTIGNIMGIVGVIGTIIIVSVVVILYCLGYNAKDKISMYEEENKKIEEQIAIVVNDYKDYEKDTLKEFKTENAIVYATIYPELKTNTLVQQQIEIYVNNNNKIKELKEAEIDMKIAKWLVYFG